MDVVSKYLVTIGAFFNLVSRLVPSDMFQPKQIHETLGRNGWYIYSLCRAAFFACAVKTV